MKGVMLCHPMLPQDDSGVFDTTLSREYAIAAAAFNLSSRFDMRTHLLYIFTSAFYSRS